MDSCRISKEYLQDWCNEHLAPHTDWTGTRIETKQECKSVQDFVDKLWDFIEDNHWRF